MHPVLEEIIRTERSETPQGDSIRVYPMSITPPEGKFLQQMVTSIEVKATVEVGLAWGVSALFIGDALAAKEGVRHVIMDPGQFDKWRGVGLHNLKRVGLIDRVEFHQDYSHRVLPQLELQQEKFDFAFIDGRHTFDYAFVDFFYIHKLLRVGGLVAFDDVDYPSIRKVCRYIATNYPYTVFGRTECRTRPLGLRRRLLDSALKLPGMKPLLARPLRPELTTTDQALGIDCTCVCFRKESEDLRSLTYHRPF
ncbi:MAG: class I SAM-dependent methyltransferase [Anaerolineales bacterium]